MGSQLTVNMGVRWDADPNMASPPNIRTNDILIDSGIAQTYSSRIAGVADYGYKSGIRDWTTSRREPALPTTSAAATRS